MKQQQNPHRTELSPEAQLIFQDLREDGFSMLINKSDYAKIIKKSISSVDNYIRDGHGLPNYSKPGGKKNSPVLFNLRDVAKYLASEIIQTA